mmetsp:Transcript_14219/g.26835  ORF Transcript_14219/g.26835 Transcript_14219/m.26835 type:complete len:262 (+) Transcript_14219:563-1348(+)
MTTVHARKAAPTHSFRIACATLPATTRAAPTITTNALALKAAQKKCLGTLSVTRSATTVTATMMAEPVSVPQGVIGQTLTMESATPPATPLTATMTVETVLVLKGALSLSWGMELVRQLVTLAVATTTQATAEAQTVLQNAPLTCKTTTSAMKKSATWRLATMTMRSVCAAPTATQAKLGTALVTQAAIRNCATMMGETADTVPQGATVACSGMEPVKMSATMTLAQMTFQTAVLRTAREAANTNACTRSVTTTKAALMSG